jgi:carboxyl-terminal processing protease
MKRSRFVLLAVSAALLLLLTGGGLAVKVGATDRAYRQVVLFSEILSLVLDNYVDPVESDRLLEGAYEGMLAGLDPNGAFLTPEELEAWKRPSAGDAGPGVSVLKSYGALQVVGVAPGSPAEEAGIQVGDQIRRIGGKPVRDLSLTQARRLLGGEPGSTVTLGLLRPREGYRRDEIEVRRAPRVDRPFVLEVERGIAVLTLLDLGRTPPDALALELDEVRSRGAERLLLDLRNLAEGTPRDAVALAGLMADGAELQLKDRGGRQLELLSASPGTVAWHGPVGVLVNGSTAGGGEALAALLRSFRDAPVYGEPTYGLGAEPTLIELPDGSGIVLSASVWEAPGGQTWNSEGLQPDQVIRVDSRGDEPAAEQLRRALEAFESSDAPTTERRAA